MANGSSTSPNLYVARLLAHASDRAFLYCCPHAVLWSTIGTYVAGREGPAFVLVFRTLAFAPVNPSACQVSFAFALVDWVIACLRIAPTYFTRFGL